MLEAYNKFRENLQPLIDWYNLHIYLGILHNKLGMTARSSQGKVVADFISKEEADYLWGPGDLDDQEN